MQCIGKYRKFNQLDGNLIFGKDFFASYHLNKRPEWFRYGPLFSGFEKKWLPERINFSLDQGNTLIHGHMENIINDLGFVVKSEVTMGEKEEAKTISQLFKYNKDGLLKQIFIPDSINSEEPEDTVIKFDYLKIR